MESYNPFFWEFPDGYFTYNRSEFLAFKYAPSLKRFIRDTRTNWTHIIAHSQGNIVASEALRLGLQVDSYMLMQAAVPAFAYDVDASEDEILSAKPLTYNVNSRRSSDAGYRGWFSKIGRNARLYSFYNPNDYGLSFWKANQLGAKPAGGFSTGSYEYVRTAPRGEKHQVLRKFYPQDPKVFRVVKDPHEVMAFMASSSTLAAGATPVIDGLDLSIGDETLLGFQNARHEHGGQFNYSFLRARLIYEVLLFRMQFAIQPF